MNVPKVVSDSGKDSLSGSRPAADGCETKHSMLLRKDVYSRSICFFVPRIILVQN